MEDFAILVDATDVVAGGRGIGVFGIDEDAEGPVTA
jgi:hypothetical protein